jgi:hypothetical protein
MCYAISSLHAKKVTLLLACWWLKLRRMQTQVRSQWNQAEAGLNWTQFDRTSRTCLLFIPNSNRPSDLLFISVNVYQSSTECKLPLFSIILPISYVQITLHRLVPICDLPNWLDASRCNMPSSLQELKVLCVTYSACTGAPGLVRLEHDIACC